MNQINYLFSQKDKNNFNQLIPTHYNRLQCDTISRMKGEFN